MSNNQEQAKGGGTSVKVLVLLLADSLRLVSSIFMVPYLTRALPQVQYGTYGQALLVVDLLAALCAVGVSRVIYMELANYKFRQGIVTASAIALVAGVSLLGTTSIWLSSPLIVDAFDNPDLLTPLVIYAAILPFIIFNQLLKAIHLFFGNVKLVALLSTLQNVGRLALILLVVQLGLPFNWIFLALVMLFVGVGLLSFATLPPHVRRLPINRRRLVRLKHQWRQGWPIGVTGLLGMLSMQYGGLYVSGLLGVERYALYRAGAFYVPFVSQLAYSVSAIVMADIAQLKVQSKRDKIIALKHKVIKTSVALIYPIAIFCLILGQELIDAYLDDRYTASGGVFILFNLVLLVRVNEYSDLLIAYGQSKFIMYYNIIATVVLFGFTALLTVWLGIYGPALASTVAIIVQISLMFSHGARVLECSIWDMLDLRQIVSVSAIAVTLSLITKICLLYIQYEFAVLILFAVYLPLVFYIILRFRFVDLNIVLPLLARFDRVFPLTKMLKKVGISA